MSLSARRLLHCDSPLTRLSGHPGVKRECPLLKWLPIWPRRYRQFGHLRLGDILWHSHPRFARTLRRLRIVHTTSPPTGARCDRGQIADTPRRPRRAGDLTRRPRPESWVWRSRSTPDPNPVDPAVPRDTRPPPPPAHTCRCDRCRSGNCNRGSDRAFPRGLESSRTPDPR